MNSKYSKSRQFGNVGEDIACKYLKNKGFEIVERNYLKKFGEIDIVAKKGSDLHFVEVKTVSIESVDNIDSSGFRPEDNVHPKKLERMAKTVEIYLMERGVSDETNWQCDLVTVMLSLEEKRAKVNLLEQIM